MDNVVKIFDNTIEYIPADRGLNYILCNELNEVFFGVYEVKIGDVVFIGESVDTIKDSPVVKIPIVIEDKEHDVLFALKKQDKTGVILNLKSLSNGRKILLDEKKIVEEAAEEIELPDIEEVIEEQVDNKQELVVNIEMYKAEALRVISENFNEKKAKIEQLQESLKKFIDNNIENIKNSSILEVDKFKSDIISSVENIVESNKIDTHSSIAEINSLRENIEISVNGYLVDLELTSAEKIAALENLREQVNFEVSTKLDEFKVDLEQYKKTTSDEFDKLEKYGNEMSQKLVEHVELTSQVNNEALAKAKQNATEMQRLFEAKLRTFQSIADKKQKSITKIVESKFTDFESKTRDVDDKLTQLDEKLSTKLVDYVGEFTAAVNEKLAEVDSIKDKLAVIGEQEASKLQELNSSIMEAVEAKVKDVKLVALKKEDLASLKKQLEERISTESANLKKYVASYGGGGSVAQQFAAGGTMNGNLTVNGQISATTIFSPSVSAAHLSAGDFHVDYIDFYNYADSGSVPYRPGRLFYEVQDDTLTLFTDNPECSMQIGQEMWVKAVNKTNTTLDNGTVVYLSGAQGNRPKMWRGLATSDFTSADTIGVLTVETLNNEEGYVTTEGIVRGIDTRNFPEGATLYLSPTIPGGITDVKPVAPQHLVKIGYALNSTVNGSIFVSVDNGYELDELHNVRITSPQNGQTLVYNSVSAIWVNSFLSGGGGGGVSGDYLPLSGGTVNGDVTIIGTLSTTLLEATSANITYIDIKQYELSGFNVTGNVSISGDLSVSGIVYGNGGNSNNWNSVFSTVNSASASWNYQGSDIKALTANWQNTYTDFSSQSSNNISVYTTVNSSSASWNSVYTTVNTNSANWLQTLSFNESNAELTISNGNTISLSALSGGGGTVTGSYLPLSGGTLTGIVSTNSDIEITDSTKGIILRSPSNFKYRVTVTDAGELVTTLI